MKPRKLNPIAASAEICHFKRPIPLPLERALVAMYKHVALAVLAVRGTIAADWTEIACVEFAEQVTKPLIEGAGPHWRPYYNGLADRGWKAARRERARGSS